MSLLPAPKSRRGIGLFLLAAFFVYFTSVLWIRRHERRDILWVQKKPRVQFELPPGFRQVPVPSGACGASIASYKRAAIKWRRMIGAATCKTGAQVSVTGSWCLAPDPGAKWGPHSGRAAQHHVVADSGVGRGLVRYLGGRGYSLVDVGAGVGQYGYWLRANNASIEWHGFDGAENVEEFTGGFVQWTDATDATLDTIPLRADWVMSLEVGEHIPPRATDEFIRTLDRHNRLGIVLSWALPWPWQRGLHHVNNLSNEQVVALMRRHGYVQNAWCRKFQKDVRTHADYSWFKSTFMVFVRETPLAE